MYTVCRCVTEWRAGRGSSTDTLGLDRADDRAAPDRCPAGKTQDGTPHHTPPSRCRQAATGRNACPGQTSSADTSSSPTTPRSDQRGHQRPVTQCLNPAARARHRVVAARTAAPESLGWGRHPDPGPPARLTHYTVLSRIVGHRRWCGAQREEDESSLTTYLSADPVHAG